MPFTSLGSHNNVFSPKPLHPAAFSNTNVRSFSFVFRDDRRARFHHLVRKKKTENHQAVSVKFHFARFSFSSDGGPNDIKIRNRGNVSLRVSRSTFPLRVVLLILGVPECLLHQITPQLFQTRSFVPVVFRDDRRARIAPSPRSCSAAFTTPPPQASLSNSTVRDQHSVLTVDRMTPRIHHSVFFFFLPCPQIAP